MISQIKIQNFQSHKETILDLHEGVNALIGLTGAGKSVVFKALDWLFRNRPLGDEYRSWWENEKTQVEIVLREGQKVGRVRTNSDNYYYIDKKEFRAFGNGPPPQPVLDLLNLSGVNFQAQADPAFLISNSSAEIARYLNRAAHLDVIDGALSNIASTLRKEKEELYRDKQELEQAQVQLIQYSWLPEAEEKLVGLEGLQQGIVHLSDQRSGLTRIVGEYGKTEIALVAVNGVLRFKPEIERLILVNEDIEKKNSQWEALAGVVDRHGKVQKGLDGLAGVAECEKKWQKVDELYKKVSALRSNRTGLGQVLEQIDWAKDEFEKVEADCERLKKEFDKLMPDVCPLCDGTGGKKK